MKNDYLKDKKIIEAFLFAADEPLDMETLQSKVSKATDVLKIVEELQNEYKDRGINLIKLANKWSFRTSIDLADQLREEVTSQKKLSFFQNQKWPKIQARAGIGTI